MASSKVSVNLEREKDTPSELKQESRSKQCNDLKGVLFGMESDR